MIYYTMYVCNGDNKIKHVRHRFAIRGNKYMYNVVWH